MIRIFMQLQIQLLGDDDLADPVMLIDNWEAARWTSSVPYPYTEADGRTWIALVQQDHATGLPQSFTVALKKTDRVIGGVALDGSASDESEEPALGYSVGQPLSAQRYKISRWHNPLILRSKQAMPRAFRYKRS